MNKYTNKFAERIANEWLKTNGINPDSFFTTPLLLVQAQRIAKNVLIENGKLLSRNEAESLNNYLQAMDNGKSRKKITNYQAYKVMNIGTSVNRKLFNQLRKVNNKG